MIRKNFQSVDFASLIHFQVHVPDLKPDKNETENKSVSFEKSVIPQSKAETKAVSVTNNQRASNILPPKTEFKFNDTLMNRDIKVAIADSTSFSDTFEESCASSVASIHQIAETLRRKSLMSEPRRAIEHLLSIGLCRSAS